MVPTFRVLTYNVHSCVGTDGRLDPGRIAEVIARSEADIVALQEVDVCQTRSDGLHQPQWLAERLRMLVHFTAARECNQGHYGNAILSRYPFALMSEGKLRRLRDETRAVQWLRLSLAGFEINVMNTHFSVHLRERLLQTEQLLGAEWVAQVEERVPLVICGDLNSGSFSPVYRRLCRDLQDAQRQNGEKARSTWPSRRPLLRLDHIFTSRNVEVLRCEVRRDALSKLASDHLPLLADLSC